MSYHRAYLFAKKLILMHIRYDTCICKIIDPRKRLRRPNLCINNFNLKRHYLQIGFVEDLILSNSTVFLFSSEIPFFKITLCSMIRIAKKTLAVLGLNRIIRITDPNIPTR